MLYISGKRQLLYKISFSSPDVLQGINTSVESLVPCPRSVVVVNTGLGLTTPSLRPHAKCHFKSLQGISGSKYKVSWCNFSKTPVHTPNLSAFAVEMRLTKFRVKTKNKHHYLRLFLAVIYLTLNV